MTILYSASKDEVQRHLKALTIANRSAHFWHHLDPTLRREAEARHREESLWMYEHGVPYTYDKTQRCYVEDETNGD